MAIYIPLDKILKSCDMLIKRFRKKGILIRISPENINYIITNITSKYGKYIQADDDVMFSPQIMPESSDPIDSKRYHRFIVNEKMNALGSYRVSFPFDPAKHKVFYVKEYSPEFPKYTSISGDGIVIKESDGSYSWWFNDISKGEQLC